MSKIKSTLVLAVYVFAATPSFSFDVATDCSATTLASGARTCYGTRQYPDGLGATLPWDLILPPGWSSTAAKTYPLLIWIPGGGWLGGSSVAERATIEQFAALGFVVATPSYYGSNYNNNPSATQINNPPISTIIFGETQSGSTPPTFGYLNIRTFVDLAFFSTAVSDDYRYDVNKISIGGPSAGGHLALMEVTEAAPLAGQGRPPYGSTRFLCSVATSTPYDLNDSSLAPNSPFAGGYYRSRAAFATQAPPTAIAQSHSPLHRVANFRASKLYQYHGTNDNLIPHTQADAFKVAVESVRGSMTTVNTPVKVTEAPPNPSNLPITTLDLTGHGVNIGPRDSQVAAYLYSNCR